MIYLGEDAIGINHMISQIGSAAKVESGVYTPTQNIEVSNVILNHSLGDYPDFVMVVADGYDYDSSDTTTNYYTDGFSFLYSHTSNNSNILMNYNARSFKGNYGSSTQTATLTQRLTQTTFTFPYTTGSSSHILKANIPFRYIVGKFNKEVTPNA